MNKFFKFILIQVFILIIINLFFLYVKNIYLDKYIVGGSRQEKMIDLGKIKNKIFLADSYGNALNDLSEFGVSNFSSPSDCYIDMENKLMFILKNTKIDTLFISINDHTLSKYRESANNISITNTLNNNKEKMILNIFPIANSHVTNLFKSFIWSIFAKLFSKNDEKNIIDNSKKWHDLDKSKKIKRAKNRIDYQFQSKIRSEILYNSLSRIIQLCKKNNVYIIGIKIPTSYDYNAIKNIIMVLTVYL